MVSHLAQYVTRHPRYVLQPHDNTLIRVAGPQQTPWEEGTEIYNVSLTGLAFTAPADLCPLLGEGIRIQFEAPGKEQMACMAMVSRVQPVGKTTMLVGVKFLKLDMSQRLWIAQGLARKLKEQMEKKNLESKSNVWTQLWSLEKARMLLALGFGALWIILLSWFWFRT